MAMDNCFYPYRLGTTCTCNDGITLQRLDAMRIGIFLGKITTPIIMGVFFYGGLLPMALIMKIIKRDTMNRSFEPDADTYRINSKIQTKEKMDKPY